MKISTQVAVPDCRALLIKSGWRVMIAAMPPTKAYTAQTNASRSAKDPNTSMNYALPIPEPLGATRRGGLHAALLRHPRRRSRTARRGFILGRALGLNVLRHKTTVGIGTPFHQRLSLVREGVRQRIRADVTDRQRLALLFQLEIHTAGHVLNRPRHHGPSDPHAVRAV